MRNFVSLMLLTSVAYGADLNYQSFPGTYRYLSGSGEQECSRLKTIYVVSDPQNKMITLSESLHWNFIYNYRWTAINEGNQVSDDGGGAPRRVQKTTGRANQVVEEDRFYHLSLIAIRTSVEYSATRSLHVEGDQLTYSQTVESKFGPRRFFECIWQRTGPLPSGDGGY